MKRFYLILVSLIIICAPALKAEFRYAPIAGVTVGNLKFKQDLIDVDQKVAFQVGVQGEMMFPGLGFGLDLGLLYNMMGAQTNLGQRKIWSADGFGNVHTALHMITIPAHLRFKWTRMNGLEDYVAPFVYGGPDFSIMAGHSNIKGNKGAENPWKYSGGDLGLTVGGGAEIMRNWQLSVQYTWGMTYLLKARKLDDYSARNRQWAVRLAYFF
ncbi:MAG: PorT family protein [Muribaculaceae bacterium]|nr:PorT family protein [Muribaculaceae bacterium]